MTSAITAERLLQRVIDEHAPTEAAIAELDALFEEALRVPDVDSWLSGISRIKDRLGAYGASANEVLASKRCQGVRRFMDEIIRDGAELKTPSEMPGVMDIAINPKLQRLSGLLDALTRQAEEAP